MDHVPFNDGPVNTPFFEELYPPLWFSGSQEERGLFPLTKELEGCFETYQSETEFIEHLTTEHLLAQSRSLEGFVFWTPERDDAEHGSRTSTVCVGNVSIGEKIRNFLIDVVSKNYCVRNLVQFWAHKVVGGRSILTTLHQPFATGFLLSKGLSWLRKKCMGHQYIVDHGADEEQLGPPGRVFRNGHPEYIPNLSVNPAKVFPLQDKAVSCGIESYLALPIFGLQNKQCIGVLEIFETVYGSLSHFSSSSSICKLLEDAGLRTADFDQPSFGDKGEAINDLSLNGCDGNLRNIEQHESNIGSGENLQNPDTDYLKNDEPQENVIGINSSRGNKSRKSAARIPITHEDIEAQHGNTQEIAASNCGVSLSTFKRRRKEVSAHRWPSNARNKMNSSLCKTNTSQIPFLNSDHQISKSSSSNLRVSDFPINSNVPNTCTESTQEIDKTRQETNEVMIRAKFKKEIVKFELRISSGLKQVEEEVVKRFNLIIGNFTLKYKDDCGYMISLKCDEDLHLYVKSVQLKGNTTDQVLQVHLVSNKKSSKTSR